MVLHQSRNPQLASTVIEGQVCVMLAADVCCRSWYCGNKCLWRDMTYSDITYTGTHPRQLGCLHKQLETPVPAVGGRE
eukprot:COSAG01_NODE_33072_length_570_cov_1.626327_2_plen_77_part_01